MPPNSLMEHSVRWLVLAGVLFVSQLTLAATLTGRVVAIADGDTLTVLTSTHTQERIRIAGIDAPEKRQPYGQAAKRKLSDLAFGRQASVEWTKRDRYRRVVGKVIVAGKDVGLEQLRAGLAWQYTKYQAEQLLEDRAAYSVAEDDAKAARRGLWSSATQVPPWEWRRATP